MIRSSNKPYQGHQGGSIYVLHTIIYRNVLHINRNWSLEFCYRRRAGLWADKMPRPGDDLDIINHSDFLQRQGLWLDEVINTCILMGCVSVLDFKHERLKDEGDNDGHNYLEKNKRQTLAP